MSGSGGAAQRSDLEVRTGDIFELVLPNYATAGFQWHPTYDENGFALVAVERRGEHRQVVFRFRALGPTGKIALNLARPGRAPHETRTYAISVTDP